jgi:hypothetical protein
VVIELWAVEAFCLTPVIACSTPTANISMKMSDKPAELAELYRQK